MMAIDVHVRAVRSNASGDGTVAALNGTPLNGSRWDPPAGPYDRMKETGPVWDPPATVAELVGTRGREFPPNDAALPARAGIALLKMRLRAALEQETSQTTDDSAREQLRSRLDLLVAQRRAALDVELEQARSDAAAAIEEAHRAAALIVEQAAAVETVDDPEPVETPEPVAFVVTPAQDAPGQLARVQPAGNVVMDAQAFAVVVATVVATLLDERFKGLGPGPFVPAPAPPLKQSFWSQARHPDVILLMVTTAIVLVILAAWLA